MAKGPKFICMSSIRLICSRSFGGGEPGDIGDRCAPVWRRPLLVTAARATTALTLSNAAWVAAPNEVGWAAALLMAAAAAVRTDSGKWNRCNVFPCAAEAARLAAAEDTPGDEPASECLVGGAAAFAAPGPEPAWCWARCDA